MFQWKSCEKPRLPRIYTQPIQSLYSTLIREVDLLGGIHTHKSDKTNETKRKTAADNVLSLSKNIANVSLVIKIGVT